MDLEEKILRLQLRKLQELKSKREGTWVAPEPVSPPHELEESAAFLTRVAVNSGPEYLPVTASVWGPKPRIHADGVPVRNLEEAREIAAKRGLKGITIRMVGG